MGDVLIGAFLKDNLEWIETYWRLCVLLRCALPVGQHSKNDPHNTQSAAID